MEIREAAPEDWARIYPFWSRIVEAGETYVYPLGLGSDDARALWMESPPGLTVVAVEGDDILGSAKMGPNRPGRGAHVATGSFMVNPERHGRGVGRALGEYVIEWARREGYHSIQFNAVVESNAPAVHLWRALGFTIVGTVPEAFDHRTNGLVGLHIMVKKL
ncbi:GNAT family N-acetyltransferase [Amorphoplanes digitatis]|uniref:GNAT superfamily N-acetyltransferase n=1 Tax=Actinoplanes digitatis TaxID=1868 RepID=A0A7W7I477_9ACTN|nr:GNAT family N-acetyltransferase [Actinoplanes digitatis]MBB4766112.1 GNAT superfamily N-acetyltransferase [Actinoplanes digitatis]